MEQVLAEVTFQARSSPDVNQTSGVSVRMSISNHETAVANALRRALRTGEAEAVPRLSDLEALETSTAGKLELEYAGADRSESEVVRDLMRRAARVVFDTQVPLEGVASVVDSFNQGWKVEVSSSMASTDYLVGLDEIPGLREAAARLAGGDSPPRLASAIEFVLEGLHLSNRLNKTTLEGKAQYARA
jgi:magnesium chelatase subunit I